jgi:hypothetical protein
MGYEKQSHDACASPALSAVLSAIADQAERLASGSEPQADGDDDLFLTVRRRIGRSAAEARKEDTEEARPHPCTPSVVSRPKSSMDKSTSSVRVSLQHSEHSETAAARELPGPKGRNWNEPPLPPSPSDKASPRSNKLSEKLAKARVKHRKAVVEGIRSLFR